MNISINNLHSSILAPNQTIAQSFRGKFGRDEFVMELQGFFKTIAENPVTPFSFVSLEYVWKPKRVSGLKQW